MSTDVKLTATDRAERTAQLREHHKATLERIDYDVVYKPKRFYTPKGKDMKHINVFPSELKLGRDIYTEKINDKYESEDDTRTLYKWPYNPQWAEAYTPVTKPGEKGVSWYLIPVSELVEIPKEVEGIDETKLELPDPEQDSPMEQMTIRDIFAIFHKKPVSHKKWLNHLITNSK